MPPCCDLVRSQEVLLHLVPQMSSTVCLSELGDIETENLDLASGLAVLCSAHETLASLSQERTCSNLKTTSTCPQPRGVPCSEPRLYVVPSGQGSPCLDLRRVSDTLADATIGTDLVIIEGMGRAIHTNFRSAASHLRMGKWSGRRVGSGNIYAGSISDSTIVR